MAMFYSDPVTYGQSLKILTNQYLNIYNSNKENKKPNARWDFPVPAGPLIIVILLFIRLSATIA